jgi:cysteinyl-tRNA synthetase
MFVDILRRSLKLFGFTPDQTMNLTDIDDKIINQSIANQVSVEEFTKPWIEAFFKDLETLGIEKVEHYPKATESIPEMLEIIDRLEKEGLTYKKDGNVYFSINKFHSYGKLSKIEVEGMVTGARYDADEYEKENARDFVLWKAPKLEQEKCWDTHHGPGRPGWHLECSAMIRQIYKSGVDIHTGGIDLLFPHHENEIAQSEGAYPEEQFVKYWLHCEHLLVDGQKMSKSLGNFYILKDLMDKGYSWREIRFVLLSFHYRTKLNFSFDRLKEARSSINRIQSCIHRLVSKGNHFSLEVPPEPKSVSDLVLSRPRNSGVPLVNGFLSALADDLNTPKALANIFESIKLINSELESDQITKDSVLDYLKYFRIVNSLLGIFDFGLFGSETHPETLDEETKWIEEKIQARIEAKKTKNFALADSIRAELNAKGIVLEDTKDGSVNWKKAT